MVLSARQSDVDPDNLPDGWVRDHDGVARPWWHSRTGYIVKWSIIAGLILAIGLFLILSYLHAQRRLRKGLAPLRYHRWMLSKRERARLDPQYEYTIPQAHYTPYAYGPPPPAYGMQPMAPPPVYQPPAPGSKFDAAEGPSDVKGAFEAPPGPPPGRAEWR